MSLIWLFTEAKNNPNTTTNTKFILSVYSTWNIEWKWKEIVKNSVKYMHIKPLVVLFEKFFSSILYDWRWKTRHFIHKVVRENFEILV